MLRKILPFRQAFHKLRKSRIPITYFEFLKFKIFGRIALDNYWYTHKNSIVSNSKRIFVGKNCLIGRPGCYIQGAGGVLIGDYVQFGPNVGILSANHDLMDQHKYNTKPIIIGKYSWVGMNSVITSGVVLGPRTIVGAGSVVTKSFPEGYCVIGGSPARLIKIIDKEKFQHYEEEEPYYGFYSENEFKNNFQYFLDIDFFKTKGLSIDM